MWGRLRGWRGGRSCFVMGLEFREGGGRGL